MEKETILPKNIRQMGDVRGREKVCIEDYVMTYIRKKEPQEEQGYLGIFLGERKEEEDVVYVFIRGIVEAPPEETEESGDPAALWAALDQTRAENFPGWEVQGCCVIGTYRTGRLERLSEAVPEAGRLIYHLQEQEETLYWKESGQYNRLRGYFVFYEQNRRMQEYLAEVFAKDSVEQESAPDRAIKSFREKVKEKGERRAGSLLRLAGSFFVVTILVIGAITVNRVDEIRQMRDTARADLAVLSDEIREDAEGQQTNAAGVQQTAEAAAYGADSTGNAKSVSGSGAQQTLGEAEAGINNSENMNMPEDFGDGSAVRADVTGVGAADLQSDGRSTDAAGAGAADLQSGDGSTERADATGADVTQGLPDEKASGAASSGAQQSGIAAGFGADNGDSTGRAENTDAADADVTQGLSDEKASGAASSGAQQSGIAAGFGTDNGDSTERAENTDASSGKNTGASSAASRAIHASYTIREGDTLADICSRYYGSLDRLADICAANDITDANRIMPGQKLVLP